jgi:hypothetical protein
MPLHLLALIARMPQMPSAIPNHAGMSAVGCALPVPKKPTSPSAISKTAKTIVTFAMRTSIPLQGKNNSCELSAVSDQWSAIAACTQPN